MCETAFSGYPDCRDDTIKSMQLALNLGMDRRFVIHTPLVWIAKAAAFGLSHERCGRGVGCLAGRGHSHMLSRRPSAAQRLGIRLRDLSGLPIARRGLRQVDVDAMTMLQRS